MRSFSSIFWASTIIGEMPKLLSISLLLFTALFGAIGVTGAIQYYSGSRIPHLSTNPLMAIRGLVTEEKYKEALVELKTYMKIVPDRYEARILYGLSLMGLGLHKQAAQWHEKMLETPSGMEATLHYNVASSYFELAEKTA